MQVSGPLVVLLVQGRRPDASVTSGNCSGSIGPTPPAGAYNITYYSTQDNATAAAIAKTVDLVVMVVATDSSEGSGAFCAGRFRVHNAWRAGTRFRTQVRV
jgi:hypothetical protein